MTASNKIFVDFYKILGVRKTASENEIEKAYRKNILKYHPDKTSDPESIFKFNMIKTAKDVLCNEQLKSKYNQHFEKAPNDDFFIFKKGALDYSYNDDIDETPGFACSTSQSTGSYMQKRRQIAEKYKESIPENVARYISNVMPSSYVGLVPQSVEQIGMTIIKDGMIEPNVEEKGELKIPRRKDIVFPTLPNTDLIPPLKDDDEKIGEYTGERADLKDIKYVNIDLDAYETQPSGNYNKIKSKEEELFYIEVGDKSNKYSSMLVQ